MDHLWVSLALFLSPSPDLTTNQNKRNLRVISLRYQFFSYFLYEKKEDCFNHLICPFFIDDSRAFILFLAMCASVCECVCVCVRVCARVFICPPLKTPNSVMPWPEQQKKLPRNDHIIRLQKQNQIIIYYYYYFSFPPSCFALFLFFK